MILAISESPFSLEVFHQVSTQGDIWFGRSCLQNSKKAVSWMTIMLKKNRCCLMNNKMAVQFLAIFDF